MPALGWLRDLADEPAQDETSQTPLATFYALSGWPFVPSPWKEDEFDGVWIKNRSSGRFRATFDIEHRLLSLFDRQLHRGVFWCDAPERLPEWEQSAPMRSLVTWALQDEGISLVHAACVGEDGRGVLLCGRGGSGKSTTALACVRAGMQTAGDDYCAVALGAPPTVHGLFSLAKVFPNSIGAALVDLGSASAPRSDGKVHVSFGASMEPSFRATAIILPTVTGGPVALRPLAPRAAHHRIAPNTMVQTAHGGQQLFTAIASLARAVPTFELDLGHDLDDVVRAIRSVLR